LQFEFRVAAVFAPFY